MHTSPSHTHSHVARTPHSSPMAFTGHPKPPRAARISPQLTHGLLTTTMHPRPPLRTPYN
ncbi:hypothetical protein PVL29_011992 [Vitis rotundifolia]|uniref:Uncharacterized protein n=1 Tax=Vitis rotundifolia TaxID=103349 RepID=A0AA38ZQG6_VITRO|nr:hypothetical protein PVL29_011992 [Vitis rotundifolia]